MRRQGYSKHAHWLYSRYNAKVKEQLAIEEEAIKLGLTKEQEQERRAEEDRRSVLDERWRAYVVILLRLVQKLPTNDLSSIKEKLIEAGFKDVLNIEECSSWLRETYAVQEQKLTNRGQFVRFPEFVFG